MKLIREKIIYKIYVSDDILVFHISMYQTPKLRVNQKLMCV